MNHLITLSLLITQSNKPNRAPLHALFGIHNSVYLGLGQGRKRSWVDIIKVRSSIARREAPVSLCISENFSLYKIVFLYLITITIYMCVPLVALIVLRMFIHVYDDILDQLLA